MAIKLLDIRYGPGYFQEAGTVMELDPKQEQELVDAGRAEYVEGQHETK